MDKIHDSLARQATVHLLAVQARINIIECDMRTPQPSKEDLLELIAFSSAVAEEAQKLATNFKLQLLNTYKEL